MEIPDKIRVGFHNYQIIFPYIFKEDSGRIGQHSATLGEIRITNTFLNLPVPDETIIQTMMHEVLHAIDSVSNLKVFSKEDGSIDEDKIDGIAEWLCMVLRDNPSLTKMFLPPLISIQENDNPIT